MRLQSKTGKLTLSSVLVALALVLSLLDTYICSFLPFVPGMKIGLAGGVTLFALQVLEKRYVAVILAARCLLAVAFYGSPTMLLFSLAGAYFSFGIMVLAGGKLSLIKVSVLGGISHNIAQTAVAVFVSGSAAICWYLPVLICTGTVSGFFTGWLVAVIIKRTGVMKDSSVIHQSDSSV